EAVDPLKDTRFGELFSNPDFEIDKNSIEYKLLHPTLTSKFAQESGNSKTSESSETDSDE
ncbi:4801_t:CDS:2, partial [Dentiscutata erythropus]